MAETVTAIADGPAGPVPPPPSSFDDLLGDDKTKKLTEDLTKLREEKIKATEEPTKKIEQDRERIEKAYKQVGTSLDDPALRPWNVDKELAERTSNPMENFGSFAYIFSIAASAFTKTPLDNALNAMAAYNNAVKKNDEDAYNKAFSAWKENSALALKRHQMQHEQYEDANRLLDTDMNLWRAKLEAAAIRFGDKKALAFLRSGMDSEALQAQEASAKASAGIAEARDKLIEAKAKMDYVKAKAWDETKQTYNPKKYVEAIRDWDVMENATTPLGRMEMELWMKAKEDYATAHDGQEMPLEEGIKILKEINQGTKLSPSAQKASRIQELMDGGMTFEQAAKKVADETRAGPPPLSEDTLRMLAARSLAGDKSAAQGLGWGNVGSQNRAALTEMITKLGKEQGKTPEEVGRAVATANAAYAGETRGASALGQRQALLTNAILSAEAVIPRVLETSGKVSRTQYSDINEILMAGEQRTGNPEVVRYGIALLTLINAYARAIGGTSSVLTDSARHEAREILQKAWSKGQISAGVDQMMTEMKSEMQGVTMAQKQFLKAYEEGETPEQLPIYVQTPAEAEKLPPGTHYITPQGDEMVR